MFANFYNTNHIQRKRYIAIVSYNIIGIVFPAFTNAISTSVFYVKKTFCLKVKNLLYMERGK